MKKTKYHHGDLRSALLAAAMQQLDESGQDRVTLREAARRAGVSHAAPARHFSHREDLLVGLAVEGFELVYGAMKTAAAKTESPTGRLHAVARAFATFAIGRANLYRLMANSSCIVPAGAVQSTARQDSFSLFVTCVGDLRSGTIDDLQVNARAFWSLLHGFAMLEIDSRQTGTPSAMDDLEATVDCLIHGFLTRPSRDVDRSDAMTRVACISMAVPPDPGSMGTGERMAENLR